MSPGLSPTSVPSGILIHPTVWIQYTNVTDRQTYRQTDRQTFDWGAPSPRSHYDVILIVTSFATELATPTVTDVRTLRTDTLPRSIEISTYLLTYRHADRHKNTDQQADIESRG